MPVFLRFSVDLALSRRMTTQFHTYLFISKGCCNISVLESLLKIFGLAANDVIRCK